MGDASQLLRDAISRNSAATLILPASAAGDSRRTRLLAIEGSDSGVWVETEAAQRPLLDALRRSGKPVGISFRTGEQNVSFNAPVTSVVQGYKLADSVFVEAALLAWPERVEAVQRRNGYRAKAPMDAGLTVRAWSITDDAPWTLVPAVTPIRGEVRDLSVGGLGVIFRPAKHETLKVEAGTRMRLEIAGGVGTIVLAARVRYTPRSLPDGSIRAGLDVDPELARTMEGRRALADVARQVAELQRGEARRRRAG